ncbi:MAG TPA: glycerol-3-phosphate dehydrogenase C-terminal domain-containing protein, partial [Agriterribacter sp.]|nr:glycerol-3-phosphate dehydrogenase C-terminal domain-containing protein [Agriterribacter sp.]
PLHYYGADAAAIQKLSEQNTAWKEKLHEAFPYIKAQVIWAVRHEMAMTVEDVLARRIRMLFLDARAALGAAPAVARLMAEEMGKDEAWQQDQLKNFTALAEGYLLGM